MISSLIDLLQRRGLLLSDQEIATWSEAQAMLHDEDIADALWLAARMGRAVAVEDGAAEPEAIAEIDEFDDAIAPPLLDDPTVRAAPPPPPTVSAHMPPATPSDPESAETPDSGLPIQVQAAPALGNPREIGRSLRSLMRKVPSLTRSELDELATVNRIAERDIWVPILKASPERWFDLELVIEASPFSFIWQDALDEFQHLLSGQGAFRNVRTWSVQESAQGQPQLVAKPPYSVTPELDQPLRSHKELVDASGRRLVLFVSDCRSHLWRQGQIHDWLALWGQHGPTAIVQLLPERLWSQSELDVGFAVQVGSLVPGTPNPKLQVRERAVRTEIAPADRLVVPVVTLTASALKQWALVLAAAGRQRSPARLFDLAWVKDAERDRAIAVIQPKSAQERLELFLATASPLAQRLARMMAAVPVELSVVYLIQQELLRDVQSVHIAEVYTSGLLEAVQPDKAQPNAPRYEFVKEVRGLLNATTPLDETLGVLEALSQRIARTLGFEIKSFTALLSPKSDWSQETQDAILPFAQIATEVLHRLGGDYAELARLVERDAQGYPDWIQPLEADASWPDLAVLDFTTAQLGEPIPEPQFPPLQMQEVEIVTIGLEVQPEDLQPFEFTVATIERNTEPRPSGLSSSVPRLPTSPPGLSSSVPRLPTSPPGLSSSVSPMSPFPPGGLSPNLSQRGEPSNEWVIRRQTQQAWQRVEQLGDQIQLEMVAIPAGSFVMGSPDDEPERASSEGPQHEVRVEAFFMGRYPVTQAQWRFVAGLPEVNRSLKPNPSKFKGDSHPVERVSWHDAVEFCERLSTHTSREYRLPSESEWEYACRAGTTTTFHFGETLTPDLANYDGSRTYRDGPKGQYRKQTTPVGQLEAANAFGLCDMHGNVWEWCQDHWHSNYEGAPTDGSAWLTDDEGSARVRRGGSWDDDPRNCRSAYRYVTFPVIANYSMGFRVVCVAP